MNFYKNSKKDKIFWVDNPNVIGEHLFSFDKKHIFNLFQDYPNALNEDQKKIFDSENPYWANFFKNRS